MITALSGMSSDRNTIVNKMNDKASTAVKKNGVRLAS
jgi:hypothetical protein